MKNVLLQELTALQETDYKVFSAKLIPNIDPTTVLGVRIPHIRRLAKQWNNTEEADRFLQNLPHRYLEENHLHGFLIAEQPDIDACLAAVDRFLPYVDNWGVCDSLRPRCFQRHPDPLLAAIDRWLQSEHPYTQRFAIEMLMVHFLDGAFDSQHLEKVAAVTCEEYYVQMMVAWYFATALAKQWDAAVAYLEQYRLSLWTHNKTIQKAVESYRITAEQKAYLRRLKRT